MKRATPKIPTIASAVAESPVENMVGTVRAGLLLQSQ
jgi:hypothetical protein